MNGIIGDTIASAGVVCTMKTLEPKYHSMANINNITDGEAEMQQSLAISSNIIYANCQVTTSNMNRSVYTDMSEILVFLRVQPGRIITNTVKTIKVVITCI